MSGNSWENSTQQCERCYIDVLPYELQSLRNIKREDAEKIDKNKHHPTHLCGKCLELGYNCRNNSPYSKY